MQIYWHEGLFLQPQHFQRMQREFGEQIQRERRLHLRYASGVIDGKPSPDELANFRLRYDSLRVLMPSGREVSFPDHADLPMMDLKPVLAGARGPVTLFLGLPLWREKRANTIDLARSGDTRARLIYRVDEKTFTDENTGENPKPVQVQRLNARFVAEQDDTGDLELLPLVRVMHGAGEEVGVPRLDPEFVPPCVFLRSSTLLFTLVRDLVAQVEASRRELVLRATQAGFSIDALQGPQLEQVLRLRTLNRFAGRLPALLDAPNVPPLEWYLELRELLGELAALRPDTDEFPVPAYDHANLFHAFSQLTQKIRQLLRVKSTSFLKVDFRLEQGVHAATLSDEHVSKPLDYFLGVKTGEEYLKVLALVEGLGRFKLLPASKRDLAVFGMKLKAERIPPVQLPVYPDLHYFRLLRAESEEIWSAIKQEKAIKLHWMNQAASDFQIALYMTLPN